VCLASVRAQSADLKPFFEISVCPMDAVDSLPYLYGMYDKNLSYLYAMYDDSVYDLYVLYDNLGPKKRSKSHLNHYGSHGYV
jgi:hypothetical protein